MKEGRTRTWLARGAIAMLCASCLDLGDPEKNDETNDDGDVVLRNANSATVLGDCQWEVESGTTDITVGCIEGWKPLHGGCQSDGVGIITDNHPWELNDASDQPENDEIWYNLSSDAGWRCAFSNPSGTTYAMALCCG